jgi:hypothetical protein
MTGGGIEDTTAAPSSDVTDTAAMPADTAVAGSDTAAPADETTSGGDTSSAGGEGAVSDSGY